MRYYAAPMRRSHNMSAPTPIRPRRGSEALPTKRSSKTRCAVVIVNHNTHAHLHECIATALRERAVEVVVVDTASTDGSAAMALAVTLG